MSKTKRDDLIVQLNAATNSKQRRKVIRKLAATRDPAVIPALVKVYNDPAADDDVRAAAGDALARFKGMHSGGGGFFAGLLRLLIGVSVLTLAGSLVLNVMAFVDDNDVDDTENNDTPRVLQVTDRNTLIMQLGSQMSEAQALATNLRFEIEKYNNTGQVDCAAVYNVPAPVALAEDDQYTYPDLRLVGNTYDALLPKFEIVLKLLENACLNPDDQTNSVIKAAQRLDEVDTQLAEVNVLLQQAITNPAPTVGPTITPVPPTPTATTAITATEPPTAAPSTEVTGPAGAETLAAPQGAAPANPTPVPTATLTPAPAAPLPNLDYAAILATMSERFSKNFLEDLQNPYGTGMLDQWQQALNLQGQQTTNYCQLTAWPQPFSLSPEQQTALNAPGVADSKLEEAIQLQQDGFALANQARSLYERDCPNENLLSSAEQGIALVSEAATKLQRSQELLDEIAARP